MDGRLLDVGPVKIDGCTILPVVHALCVERALKEMWLVLPRCRHCNWLLLNYFTVLLTNWVASWHGWVIVIIRNLVVATWCQRDNSTQSFSPEEEKKLEFLYSEWTHPHFISINVSFCCCRGFCRDRDRCGCCWWWWQWRPPLRGNDWIVFCDLRNMLFAAGRKGRLAGKAWV